MAAPRGLSQELAQPIPAAGNAWHVEMADTTGDSEREILYACYDGRVCCQGQATGKVLWQYETHAFPYDLATADLDGDSRAETLVAAADGRLYVLAPDGKLAWRFEAPAPLYQVAAAKTGDGVLVLTGGVDRNLYVFDAAGRELKRVRGNRVIRNLAAGDLDGDGFDEIVTASHLCEVEAFAGAQLKKLWRRMIRPIVDGKMQRRGHWRPYSICLDDLDGDGKCEILLGSAFYNKCGIRLLSNAGEVIWDKPGGFRFRDGTHYSHSAITACDVVPGRGKEILVLNARRLFVFDQQAKPLAVAAAPVSFTDIFIARSAPGSAEVLLASSPSGDDRLYRLKLASGWEKEFEAIPRTGNMARITRNLDRVREQIARYKGATPAGKYLITVTGGQPETPRKIRSHFGMLEFYRKSFPYPNLTFAMTISVAAKEGVPGFHNMDHRTASRRVAAADIPALLKTAEDGEAPFIAAIGHGCEPQITLETAEQIMRTCPKYFLGFMCSENTRYTEQLEHYFNDYWFPLMDLCKRHGKKAVLIEKGAWWATIPAMKRFRKLVDGTYADVLVMSVEDSNSRSPELNLAGRAGLFMAGAVNTWSARTISDELCWNRYWEWEFPMTGHPFLRRQMAQALLGARMFEFHLSMHTIGKDRTFTTIGRECSCLLFHMLGKGLLRPPKPDEVLGVSPVAICMREPDEKFLTEAYNLHGHRLFEPDPDQRDWPLEGLACHWGAAPVRPSYLGHYLFEQDRHYGAFVPATPFGFPLIVPAFIGKDRLPGVADTVRTDGRWLYVDGKRLSGKQGREVVLSRFRAAAERLPIRAQGHVFAQVQRTAPGRLRVTLVDPRFLDPSDRDVTLSVRTQGPVRELVDLLSGQAIPIVEGRAKLTVPAATFRILETR